MIERGLAPAEWCGRYAENMGQVSQFFFERFSRTSDFRSEFCDFKEIIRSLLQIVSNVRIICK